MRLLLALLIFAVLASRAETAAAPQQPDRLDAAIELARQRKYDKALEEFRAILEAEPNNRRAAALLAAMELQTGQVQQAMARAKALVEADPKNPDLHELLGQAYMAAHDWESAEKEWRTVLEDRPNSEQAHVQLGATLLQRDRFEAALGEVSKALEINPRRGDAYSLRGNILASLGRLEAAAGDWTKALAADPNDSVALSGLAVYLREREPERALAYARKAVEATEGRALGPLRVLALVHRTRGEPEQARQVLERALLTFPQSDLLQAELRAVRAAVRAATAAAPITMPAAPPPSAESASGALAAPFYPEGVTLGASARDLAALLPEPRQPEFPPEASPLPSPSAAERATDSTELRAPEIDVGLPLERIVLPFAYADVVPPPQEVSDSLGDLARRVREEKAKQKDKP